MVRIVKKLISIILAVAVIMSGTLILPPQGLAEVGNTISGTISLPGSVTAPLGGIEGTVKAWSEDGDVSYLTNFNIPQGVESTTYAITLPIDTSISDYRVRYYLNESYPGYVGNGYYSSERTTADYDSATFIDLNSGNATGINLTIYTGNTINGTISLSEGTAPASGIEGEINIFSDCSDENYYGDFYIAPGSASSTYSVTVPDQDSLTEYRVQYYSHNQYPGYVNGGYYSLDGTTANYSSAALVNASSGNQDGIDLTIYTGNVITGTIALPTSVNAPFGGLEGNIYVQSENDESNYYSEFEIEAGNNSTTYSVTVPEYVNSCRVSYYLYDGVSGYLSEGYYYSSSETTTKYSSATLIDPSSGNISNINLRINTGSTISGIIALPNNVYAPAGGIEGSLEIYTTDDNDFFYSRFEMDEGDNSVEYTVTVPEGDEEYQVSYYLYDTVPGFLRNGYYALNGTTLDYGDAAPVVLSGGNVNGINLTILTGSIISGTILLPNGEVAPEGGLEGNINLSPVNGGYSYSTNFFINSEDSSVDYQVTLPEEALNAQYRVSYYLYDNYSAYLGNGYYATGGTTPYYNSASEINLSEGIGVDITLLKGVFVSGTISLPGGERAPNGGIRGGIDLLPVSGGYSSYVNFSIPSGGSSVDYTVTLPINTSNTLYRVQYYLHDSYPGYLKHGYYSSNGIATTDYNSAAQISVSTNDVTGIDFTLLTGVTISGSISLPEGETAPSEGIEGEVSVAIPNGVSYSGDFSISAGESFNNYTITIPESTSVNGYIVSYVLNNNDYNDYINVGYYLAGETTTNYDSATRVNVSTEDVSGIDLTLLKWLDNPDDHGNTLESASAISLGTSSSNQLYPAGDIDFFKFIPNQTCSHIFTTISDYDTYGYLFDATGNELVYNDDDGDGNNLLITYDLQAGQTYYLKVRMFSSTATGSYQLSVTETATNPVPVSAITLDLTSINLKVGETQPLIATILPENATDKSVTWTVSSQSGSNIASVFDGVVTAINPGTAVIKVASNANSEFYAECFVTVNPPGDKTALLSAITQALTIHDSANEGTAVGQYAIGSKAILQAAITQAQAVASDGLATDAQVTQAIANLTDAVDIFEAGKVLATGFSATPIVELGVNPNDSDSAGLFIGLAGIKDSANNPVANSLISGYEIEVNFDPDQVFIPYALDQSNSGELFSHNVETSNGIGKVLVSCASGSEISSFDQLFFIPIVLKGSARDLTSISVVYKDVRDDDIHRIQIPTVGNLRFQKGKIFNEDLTYPETSIAPKPGVADAIAGLQYLANRRSVGLGPNYVNPVNMASIIETQNTIANPSVKDIIALLQYTVNLRDDQFQPLNVVPGKLEFGYHRTVGTNNGIKLEIFDSELENGDLVQLLRGSDNTDLISPVTVEKTAAGVPLVLDNITFDSELYLRLKITRGNLVGERLIFESMKVSMAGFKVVDNEDVTDITVSGLQTGDQVNLYTENETQIGSPLTVAAGSSLVTFSNINIANSGLRVEIIRPNPVSRTPKLFFRWEDMINFGLKSELSSNGLMSVTVEYLESGDVVNLFDIAGVPVPGRVGLPAVDGKVIMNDLSLTAYYVEVIRGGFHSRKKMTKVPIGRVEFGVGIHEGSQSGKQLHLYDLQIGDEVEVFRGSDNSSLINPIIVDAAKPSPFIIDNVSFGNELFLKVRVMRNGLVGMREVFENLSIGMGTLESNNSTSIYVEGLISGDEVTLFKASGPQIGSTQIIAAGSTETVFNNVSLTNEDGIKVQIRRPNPDSLTPSMFQSWGKLINFYWHVEQTANGLETIIVGGLISGDVVNLYDINGVPIAGKQGLSSDANSQVTLRDLVPQVYQIEVVRGTVHSNWQKIKSPIPSTVVTETPAITGTIRSGDTSISGTAPAEATIRLSIDGVATLPVIADLNGNWTVSGLTLSQGNVISVSAQSAGKAISPAYVVTVSGPDVQVLDPGTVTGEFEHWKINTTGLEALTDYELSLSDNSVIEVTTDENKSIQFTEAQMETLASLGAETIEIRKPANSLTPASPFVTLLTVSSIGEAPINLERDPGNDGYNTGDEVLLGGDISGKPYEIKVGSDIWTGEISNQPHVSLTGSGDIANLTIPSAETTLLIRLQGLADKVPSMSWAVPCDLGGGGGGSGESGGGVTPNPYLNVTSSSFEEGGVIPDVHILSGDENDYTVPGAENQSIPLNWGTAAQAGHSFFIIMTDVYANNWNHWVVKNIPNTITSLNAGASETSDQPGTGSMPLGSEELLTTWGQDAGFTNGYYGPKPPSGSGTHHYVIEVFELDIPYIDTTDETIYGYTYNQLREKINGHIVRSGKLSGTYTAP